MAKLVLHFPSMISNLGTVRPINGTCRCRDTLPRFTGGFQVGGGRVPPYLRSPAQTPVTRHRH
jgi:hypothetical protein